MADLKEKILRQAFHVGKEAVIQMPLDVLVFKSTPAQSVKDFIAWTLFPELLWGQFAITLGGGIASAVNSAMQQSAANFGAHNYINRHLRTRNAMQSRQLGLMMMQTHLQMAGFASQYGNEAAALYTGG